MGKPTSRNTPPAAPRKAPITVADVCGAFKAAAPKLNPPRAEICAEIARFLNSVRETEAERKPKASALEKDYDAARRAIRKLHLSLPRILKAYESAAGPNMRPAAHLRDLLAAAERVAKNWPSLDGSKRRPRPSSKFANVPERVWILAAQDWQQANPGTRIGNPTTEKGRATAALAELLALAGWGGVTADAVTQNFKRKLRTIRLFGSGTNKISLCP